MVLVSLAHPNEDRMANRIDPLRLLWAASLCCLIAASARAVPAKTDDPPPPAAAAKMNEPGAEAQLLARDAGTWDVTATLQATPDGKPQVTKGLVAERVLVGNYLQETLKPAPDAGGPEFTRIEYLTYSRVEGRWQYVSMDTRFPVGIMPATSFDKGDPDKLTLEFAPLGFVGLGDKVDGKLVRSDFVITRDGRDHQLKQQHWVQADGSGKKWLAVQYEYRRRRP